MTFARINGIVALVALVALLTACGTSEPHTGGGGSTASSINGVLVGYPYAGSATVQAFAPEDGSQLAGGTLFPGPNARVEAALTVPPNVPVSAYVVPSFCNGVTVSPATTRTTGVVALGVRDSGGLFGMLMRSTFNPNSNVTRVGDTLYVYLLSNTTSSVRGNCVQDGLSYSYDISLRNGWTAVSGRVTALDSFGNPSSIVYTTDTAASTAPWYFTDVSFVLGTEPASVPADTSQGVMQLILRGIGR